LHLLVLPGGQRHPQDAAILASHQQPALWIELEADPRTLALAGRAQQFDLVTRRHEELGGIGDVLRSQGLLPLRVVVERIDGGVARRIAPADPGDFTEGFRAPP
jgi:hypothetical protein